MRDILFDTNVLVDFLGGDPDAVEAVRSARAVLINPVVLAELLAGFSLGSGMDAKRRLVSGLLLGPRTTTLQIDKETAEHYVDIHRGLQLKGSPIPTNDMWIAASAREHGLVLFTRDAHFRQVDGLLTASSADQLLP